MHCCYSCARTGGSVSRAGVAGGSGVVAKMTRGYISQRNRIQVHGRTAAAVNVSKISCFIMLRQKISKKFSMCRGGVLSEVT
jgi:hypothetical protein